jgi:hypothetical protein
MRSLFYILTLSLSKGEQHGKSKRAAQAPPFYSHV